MADARSRAARKLVRDLAEGRPKDLEVFDAGDGVVVFSWSEAEPAVEGLGPALADVLRGVCDGESNAAIAARRGTSVRTVENQVAALMRKLGATSRVDLARRAIAAPSRPRGGR